MAPDVLALRKFYESPLGRVAARGIGAIVSARWSRCAGLSIAGIGFAPPYLDDLRTDAVRVLALMPAAQGVVHWPAPEASSSALVDTSMLPLPDGCIDRALVVHALEVADMPGEMLAEVWRVLTPGGRMIVVAPSRAGVWARSDSTPFGDGRPYSRGQLRELLDEANFAPILWTEALYMPPFRRPILLRAAAMFERACRWLSLPGGGVHVVEATKQVYRPVPVRRSVRRMLPQLTPAPASSPTRGGR